MDTRPAFPTRLDERRSAGEREFSGHVRGVCVRDLAAGRFHLRKGSWGTPRMNGSSMRATSHAIRFGARTAAGILGVIILLLLTLSANAQTLTGFSVYGQIVDQTGKPAPFSQLRVCAQTGGGTPCSPLSTIYSDPALTHVISNPITTDSRGNYNIFVSAGYYILQFTVTGSGTYSYVASATVGGGGGGGGNPGGVFHSTQFQQDASTFGGGASLLNANGDFIDKSTNAMPSAFLNQPTTNSNTGIVAELQAGSTVGSADPNYPGIEWPASQGPGTVTVTNGSTAIVGTGTDFLPGNVGFPICISGGTCQNIASVTDTTHATLTTPWSVASGTVTYSYETAAYWRTPFGTNGIEQLPPAIGANTYLQDRRPGSIGSVYYNPTPNYPNVYDMFLQDNTPQQSGAGGQWSYAETYLVIHCCGKNEENFDGDQTVHALANLFMVTQASGIGSGLSINLFSYGDGDKQIMNLAGIFSGSCKVPSDECHEVTRTQYTQATFPAVFNATANPGQGATNLPLQNISGTLPGEGNYLTLPFQAGAVLHMTTIVNPYVGGASNPGQATVLETLSTDTFGSFVETINTPLQYIGATTNETINLTNLTAAIVKNSTFPTACVNDSQYNEEAEVVSAGSPSGTSPNITQTVVLALRHSYNLSISGTPKTGIVTQGPNACKGLELLANQTFGYVPTTADCPTTPTGLAPCPVRYMAKVIGVPSSHVIDYSLVIASDGWDSIQNGAVYPSGPIPAPTLTRSANVVTLNTTGDNFIPVNGDNILVSGCSDSSYNGTFGPITQGATTLTWANTGSGGSTTGCNPIALISQNGLPANAVQMMPAPVIVQAENPTTFAQTGVVTEANNYTITTNDAIEAQPGGEVGLFTHNTLVGFQTPASASDRFVNDAWVVVGVPPDGMTFMQYGLGNIPQSWLAGGGGTRNVNGTIISLEGDGGLFQFWIRDDGSPVSNAQLFSMHGCGAYANCENQQYLGAFLWDWTFDSAMGGYEQRVIPGQDLWQSVIGGGTATNGFSIIQQSATTVTIENNAASGSADSVWTLGLGTTDLQQGGPVSGQNYFEESKCALNTCFQQITNQTTSAQSTFTQNLNSFTLTGGPTALDASSTINSQQVCLANGTNCPAAGILVGSVVTTAATSDTITITGMTSGGHCSMAATNAGAATNIATSYISAKATNSITLTHVATASMTYDFVCSAN